MQRAAVWLPFCVILLVLRVVSRQVETAVGVEFLEFDLGFKAVCFTGLIIACKSRNIKARLYPIAIKRIT